jgi:hypothetical protein
MEFKARMQKYQGWIANITECPDFKMQDIENEVVFLRVIAPIEASMTMDELFQGLHDVTQELLDRANSPLVDTLHNAFIHCQDILTYDYQITKFLGNVCAQGSLEALKFCLCRGPSWMLTRDSTFPDCLAKAIEHNHLDMAKHLVAIKNPFTSEDGNGESFVQYVFGMTPFKNGVSCRYYTATTGRLYDTVRNLIEKGGFDMIRWLIQYMSVWEVTIYIFYTAIEMECVDVIRFLYPTIKETIENSKIAISSFFIRNNAVTCAKVLYELGTNLFDPTREWDMKAACDDPSRMPLFMYMVEELRYSVFEEDLIIHIYRRWRCQRSFPQLGYLLTRSIYTTNAGKSRLVSVLLRDFTINNDALFHILDSGFVTPDFPELIAPFLRDHLSGETKEVVFKFLQYGVPCDENTMCAVIGNPEHAAIVFERGGEQVLTPKVWNTMLSTNTQIDETVWGWFTSRGFAVDEQALVHANSSLVLKWCLQHAPTGLLTGNDAFYENIQRNDDNNCLELLEAGMKPNELHLMYADSRRRYFHHQGPTARQKSRRIVHTIEKNVIPVHLGKRKTRAEHPIYKT